MSERWTSTSVPIEAYDRLRDDRDRLREALTEIAEHEPSSGPDYTPNIIAYKALGEDS